MTPPPKKNATIPSAVTTNSLKQANRKREVLFVHIADKPKLGCDSVRGFLHNQIQFLFPICYYSLWLYSPFIVKRWLEKLQS